MGKSWKNKDMAFWLWRGMPQNRDFDRSRHLWTAVYWTGVLFEVWTGGSRNQARLVNHGQGAGWDKSRGVSTILASLLTCKPAVAYLWRLDTLGFTDPAEIQSIQGLEQAALDHFKETVITDKNGHYEVFLPWLGGHMLYQRIWMLRESSVSPPQSDC